jgi:predicted transcriptional regulator
MYLLPTLCNKHEELSICYLNELDQPIYIHKRNNNELTEIEKNILRNKETYNFYLSIKCFHKKSQNELPKFYILNKETNTLVDELGNNINIYFEDKIKLSNADQKMIKALRNKNINVEIKSLTGQSNYHFIYKKNNFTSMSNVLRQLLEKLADSIERLEFLKNFFKGEDMVILGGGPSTGHLTDSEMNYIFENHLTICVKYVLDLLIKKDKDPTFFIFNQYLTTNTIPYYKNLSKNITSIFGSDGDYKHKNNGLILLEVDDVHFCIRNFNNLLMNHVDCLTWKLKDNQRTYINMHIMCEMALPLCIHLGILNIYTTGWDLKLINNQDYCFETNTKSYLNNKISEYKYVPNIKTILNNLGITIHKIKESPILLDYKNIFT